MTNSNVVNNVTQDHVQSEFFHNGVIYQGNVKGLVKLCQVLKGQRNALKLALQWGLQRGLISTQNNQKAPLMAALAAIASEEPALLKKAVQYAETYAPFLEFKWQDKVSAKGIISVDDKSAPEVTYKSIDAFPVRKLVARLEPFLTWKAPKAPKVVRPVTEKQAATLADRLDASQLEASEKIITKLMTGKNAAIAAMAALEGIKVMLVQGGLDEFDKAALLPVVESLTKHLQPTVEESDNTLSTEVTAEKSAVTVEQQEEKVA